MPTTSVRRRISRFSRSLTDMGLFGQIWPYSSLRVGGEREDAGAGLVEMRCDGGQLVGEGVDDPVERGVHRRCVGLVIAAVQQGFHPAQLDLGVALIRFTA